MTGRHVYTIRRADIGKPWVRIEGTVWLTSSWIGRILPQDVGKRVYMVDDVLQVENDRQHARRTRNRYPGARV